MLLQRLPNVNLDSVYVGTMDLRSLIANAKRMNESAKEIPQIVKALEDQLNELNVTLTVFSMSPICLTPADNPLEDRRQGWVLGYEQEPSGERYRFTLREVTVSTSDRFGQYTSWRGFSLFNEAPREVQLQAMSRFEQLIRRITTKAKQICGHIEQVRIGSPTPTEEGESEESDVFDPMNL